MTGFEQAITDFFTSIETILKTIAPLAAMIGMIFAAILHFGASFPVVRTFKERNPDITANLVTGFFILFIAGGVVSMINL